jgi:ferredoxin
MALSMNPFLEEKVKHSKDRLLTAIRIAIAGNVIDFGAQLEFELDKDINDVLYRDFAIFHYEVFKKNLEKEKNIPAVSKAAIAFNESGKTETELFNDEQIIIQRFRDGAPWVGIFLGLSLAIGLFSLTIRDKRTEYKPHQGRCYSCGKCFKYCPIELKTV